MTTLRFSTRPIGVVTWHVTLYALPETPPDIQITTAVEVERLGEYVAVKPDVAMITGVPVIVSPASSVVQSSV